MARYHRRRPLRYARGRDAQLQRSPRLRQQRAHAASRQSERHQGAAFPRQGRSQSPARRDYGRGSCPDPALDRDEELQARPEAAAVLARGRLSGEQPAYPHRPGDLYAELRRFNHAAKEGPEAAGPAVFRAGEAVSQAARNGGRTIMAYRGFIASITLASGLCMLIAGAQAFDESKYPDWKGKWDRQDPPRWVQRGDKAPLTAEYQAIFDANVADQKAGGMGTEPSWMCLPPGMPRIMNAYEPMEIVITPATTHIFISHVHDNRRIFTDGRDWPREIEPSFSGYSIGKWLDTDGDGRYDTLEVETRGLKGPRSYDTSGLPLHRDNQSVIKERIYLDKADPNTIYDEITVNDQALTRPWSIVKKASRKPGVRPNWHTEACSEDNIWVRIGNEAYYLSADGALMPIKKNQTPPDLKYFSQTK